MLLTSVRLPLSMSGYMSINNMSWHSAVILVAITYIRSRRHLNFFYLVLKCSDLVMNKSMYFDRKLTFRYLICNKIMAAILEYLCNIFSLAQEEYLRIIDTVCALSYI